MGVSSSKLGSSRNQLRLKWATVVLPLLFVGVSNFVGHFVYPYYLHSLVGFLASLAIFAAGIFLFSRFVFTRIERAEHQARSRNQEMLILKTVAAAASQPMKLQELLQIAVDGVVEATGVDGGVACVLDEKQRELLHVAYRGIPEELLGPLKKVKLDEDPIGAAVVSTGEPVQIRDLTQDPLVGERGRRSGFCSVLSLPLKSEGKVKGVMALVTRSPYEFESSRVQFLLTLGGQLALAIDRAQFQQHLASVAILEERERIAREMHDGLAQVLGYINAKTSAISRLLSDGNVESARQEVAGLREAAREVSGDVREAILGLRLAGTGAGTLVAGLKEYVENFATLSGIKVAVDGLDSTVPLAVEMAVEIQVMRIVQEALTNVRKHAQASHVRLSATQNGGQLRFIVEDDGRGFEVGGLTSNGVGHFGIQTMRERATIVGGDCKVESTPGEGTRVTATVPLQSGNGES